MILYMAMAWILFVLGCIVAVGIALIMRKKEISNKKPKKTVEKKERHE
jgi:hypothetical protein